MPHDALSNGTLPSPDARSDDFEARALLTQDSTSPKRQIDLRQKNVLPAARSVNLADAGHGEQWRVAWPRLSSAADRHPWAPLRVTAAYPVK
jgi:hypothetical protein